MVFMSAQGSSTRGALGRVLSNVAAATAPLGPTLSMRELVTPLHSSLVVSHANKHITSASLGVASRHQSICLMGPCPCVYRWWRQALSLSTSAG